MQTSSPLLASEHRWRGVYGMFWDQLQEATCDALFFIMEIDSSSAHCPVIAGTDKVNCIHYLPSVRRLGPESEFTVCLKRLHHAACVSTPSCLTKAQDVLHDVAAPAHLVFEVIGGCKYARHACALPINAELPMVVCSLVHACSAHDSSCSCQAMILISQSPVTQNSQNEC